LNDCYISGSVTDWKINKPSESLIMIRTCVSTGVSKGLGKFCICYFASMYMLQGPRHLATPMGSSQGPGWGHAREKAQSCSLLSITVALSLQAFTGQYPVTYY
jgi:hypothetical protein